MSQKVEKILSAIHNVCTQGEKSLPHPPRVSEVRGGCPRLIFHTAEERTHTPMHHTRLLHTVVTPDTHALAHTCTCTRVLLVACYRTIAHARTRTHNARLPITRNTGFGGKLPFV
jgi:hypothetical protein